MSSVGPVESASPATVRGHSGVAHVIKAKYTGPKSKGQSASRLTNYLEYRRERAESEKEEAERPVRPSEGARYERLEETFGDGREFRDAAKKRAEEGRRSSYVHVVISPEHGERLSTGDFGRIKEQWVYNHRGEELPHFAAVHRNETEHDHLHIAVARDKFVKADLEDRKEATHEIIVEREREPEREEEFERQMEKELYYSERRSEREGQEPATHHYKERKLER